MGMKRWIRSSLNSLLKRYNYEIIHSSLLYEWQRNPRKQSTYNSSSQLPEDAESYLQQDNPALKDLEARYAVFDKEVTTPSMWTANYVKPDDILYFRGDNAYVWQLRGPNMREADYALTTYYVKSIDKYGLLSTLKEDDLFGNFTFTTDGRIVSRDLLDSIVEIYFLERHLSILSSKHLTIADIGAGYGRLAHRTACAVPNIKEYICTDAFPISTYISDYYVRFRNVQDKVKVVPLDEIENTFREKTVNIAVNVHSFSECSILAVEWWVSLLAKYGVKYMMIVPDTYDNGGHLLITSDGQEFGKIIQKYGYRLIAKEPKYRDSVVHKYAINPTYHYLFERC